MSIAQKLMSAQVGVKDQTVIVGHDGAPYVSAYPWTAADGFGAKFSNPSSALSYQVNGAAFSPSMSSVAVTESGNIGAFQFDPLTGFGTKFSALASTFSITYRVNFNPSGTAIAAVGTSSPYIAAYEW
ncbi:hypothetical protein, partial [Hahella sp. CCB-MM4]